jgi:hypothetical protein
MVDTDDEDIIPVEEYEFNDQILGVRTSDRKAAKRTLPPPLKDEDPRIAKRLRRESSTSSSTAADGVVHHVHTVDTATTDSPDDTLTDSVSPAALLPIATTSRAPLRHRKPAEDAKLMEVVRKYGKDWVAVATLVPGRTKEQCRQRWVSTLNPSNGNKGKWTPADDAKLMEVVNKYGKDWVVDATLLPGRTNAQCRKRWVDTLNIFDRKKGKWMPAEDAKLTEAMKKDGKDWVAVAKLVPGRTHKQCRQRWVDTLNPSNGKKGKWTPAEHVKLTEAIKKRGKNWSQLLRWFPVERVNIVVQDGSSIWIQTTPQTQGRKIITRALTRRLTRYRYNRKDTLESYGAIAILTIVYDILYCNISLHDGMV